MKQYQSHKTVEAAPITEVGPTWADENNQTCVTVKTEDLQEFNLAVPKKLPQVGDYIVRYLPDHYTSWSPKAAFEAGNRLMPDASQAGVFRKLPIEVEAFQYQTNDTPAPEWFGECRDRGDIWFVSEGMGQLNTAEGVVNFYPGDWIIRGVKGEVYPCKADIFAITYEVASA